LFAPLPFVSSRGFPEEGTMNKALFFAVMGIALASAQAATAGPPRPFTPEPGDTSLRSKCRSEASMMGGGFNRGSATHSMQVQEMRRSYFKRCMQGA
jgi:hypothetical protein